MLKIPGYINITKIYESANSIVCRSQRSSDNQTVILKRLKGEYPTPEQITRYKLEYEITRNLTLEGTIRAYGLEKDQNSLVMILENFGGESLKILVNQRKILIDEFLNIAIKVAEILGTIHQQNIIHKDINSANILYNPTTGQVKIIDFGISTVLSRETQSFRNPNVLEGTLAYMSPEQTGRMNSAIDYRTDFYSLGVTFYELLTNQLPFAVIDPMELIHCHIAKLPQPPCQINPESPQVISDLVLKLMAKTAEERYQSAWGLKADLEKCLHQLQTHQNVVVFPLGEEDISDRFQIPQKLYGREREIETLLTAFDRVSQGKSEMMLIAGYSGIGKSALVQEIYKPITEKRGYFISGKFDQFQRNIPYSALIQAFKELIGQILTEPAEQIANWKEKIITSLGINAQVIIDVIPEVELIIGKQSPVAEVGARESQNRFNLVFQNFINVFTNPEHPLVIFLDDLQWVESASLKMIELLITAPDSQYLLLILAYRNNEVSPAHPLMLTLDSIRKTGTLIQNITLAPLELATVNQLILETLKSPSKQAELLAELVHEKTQGNPFFLNEFFKYIYTKNLLNFDVKQGEWQWNLELIKNLQISDNVVELMASKIQKLSEKTQNILKLAACIGNKFDLKTLSVVSKLSFLEIGDELWQAVEEGLILPIGNDYKLLVIDTFNELKIVYKFVHDRVQQAAYSLIPENRKQAFHLEIGQLLLKDTPLEEKEEKIFDIVNQINGGISLIDNQEERDQFAKLNLIAGKKAKAATAYQTAYIYLRQGLELLGVDRWQFQYPLCLELYVEAAELGYLCGDFYEMDRLVNVVLEKANTLLDKVEIYQVKIASLITQNKLLDAINMGLTVLKMLGIHFPQKATNLDILLSLMELKFALIGTSIENLINQPPMTDPNKLAAIGIILSINSIVYNVAPKLLPVIIFKSVNLSVKYGNFSLSPIMYASYGSSLCGVLGDIELGGKFGNLALNLLDKINNRQAVSKTVYLVNAFIKHFHEHGKHTLQAFRENYSSCIETGDLEYAGYCANLYCYYSYCIGETLAVVEKEGAKYSNALQKLKQTRKFYNINLNRQMVLNLMGDSDDPCCLIGEAYDELERLPLDIEANDRYVIFNLYVNKMILFYLFENIEKALEYAHLAANYVDSATGTMLIPIFYLYDSLVTLKIYQSVPKSKKKTLLQKVERHQTKMKKWAVYGAMNYLHKFYMVEAELHQVFGEKLKAMDCYDRAIALAKENEYINEEALGNELAAKFYLETGKDAIARVYMQQARYCYQHWGAMAKVNDLEARYPQLLQKLEPTTTGITSIDTSMTSTSGKGGSEALDLGTVIKASQTLSGEILLDKLLAQLMKILIENAGAQKGSLILETQGNLLIEAECSGEDDSIKLLQSVPIENSKTVSPAIINYVARTLENVVLNNATREGKFTNDSYIQTHQPKSVICIPLINQGKLSGILYLENNLTTGAFTSDRLAVLTLLSSQAAISIENAKLYSEVREKERRLAQFLEAMPVGVGVIDVIGKPQYTNRIAEELLGKGVTSEITAEKIADTYQIYYAGTNQIYPSDQLSVVRALKGEETIIDNIEIHQGDKIIPIESRGTPIYDEKGNIAYAIVAFQDITERKRAEAEREKFTSELFELNQAYARFVPREFLHFLNKESIVDVKLGDQVEKEMSVLFSDIRNFTTLSETMTPEDNFKFINSYLSRMEPAIIENNGFIDKYIGDAIMALFPGSADDAVKAGIAMLHRLPEYNENRAKSGYIPIKNGIGINTGSLMLGTVGGQNRMDGTVISDAVNLASRIEGLTKNYGVSMLIAHNTFANLQNPNAYGIRMIDTVQVKGKSELVTVYEVFDADLPEVREGKFATSQIFLEALSRINLQQFREASILFQDCLERNPGDTVARIYLQRCQNQN